MENEIADQAIREYKEAVLKMQTMQGESYLFQGWKRKIEGTSFKVQIYRKMLSNLKNEITNLENIIQQMKCICKEVMESASLQVTINSFSSFTAHLNQAAEFIREFVDDSDEETSNFSTVDTMMSDNVEDWLSKTCDTPPFEHVDDRISFNSKFEFEPHSALIKNTGTDLPCSPEMKNSDTVLTYSSEIKNIETILSCSTEIKNTDTAVSCPPTIKNNEILVTFPPVIESSNTFLSCLPIIENVRTVTPEKSVIETSPSNRKFPNINDLTKQPVVLVCPLNISYLSESKTINVKDYSDFIDIHIINQTRSKTLPQVGRNRKGNELEDDQISLHYEGDDDTAGDGDNVAQGGSSNEEIVDDEDSLHDSVIKTEIKYDYNSTTELPEEINNFQSKDLEQKKAEIVVDTFFSAVKKMADDSQIISGLQRNFICDYCQRAFLQKPTLRKHILICSKRNDGFKYVKVKPTIVNKNRYECKLCKSKFASKKTMDKHNERTHNLKRSFKCLVCSWGFFNEEALQVHCSTRHGLSEYKQYRCPYCKDSFGKRSELNYHCRKYHGGSRFYICSFCYESFSDESVFKDHEQGHGYRCDVCMFITKSKSEITAHRATHLQLVVFSCGLCARTFNKKRDFSKHINRHEREKRSNLL